MKNLVVLLIVFFSFSTFAQQKLNHLKFNDSSYFYYKAKKANVNFKYTVDIKLSAVEVIATDDQKVDKFKGQGKKAGKKNGNNKPLSIIAIPSLFNVQNDGDKSVFMFGENAAEGNLNSAEITVTKNSTKEVSTGAGGQNNQSIKVGISGNEFYSYPEDGALGNKSFLYVNPGNGEKMEISIQREAQRGKVYVCIFDKNGKFLKALDPKDPSNSETALFYVTNSPVYVIPVIAATTNNTSIVSFEVGDPKEIARVDIEEE